MKATEVGSDLEGQARSRTSWRQLGFGEWRLFIEAYLLVAMSSAAIGMLPFPAIGRIASAPLRRPPPSGGNVGPGRIAWAVTAAAKRSPWRAVCFQQGLAAQIMLRRRGVDSTLYFGAAPDAEAGLVAHVWVRTETSDVVGCEVADRFPVLAAFPSR